MLTRSISTTVPCSEGEKKNENKIVKPYRTGSADRHGPRPSLLYTCIGTLTRRKFVASSSSHGVFTHVFFF